MKQRELVLILDFGAQYRQLIARRIREAGVYCEVKASSISAKEVQKLQPKGIVLSGGPSVVYEEDAPKLDPEILNLGIPILGICYGAQLLGHMLGGKVEKAAHREYGKKELHLEPSHALFKDLDQHTSCWMSHTYYLASPPEGFAIIAETDTCPVAGVANDSKQIYGLQFHPEVVHTPQGSQMIRNFLFELCACKADWKMESFADNAIMALKEKIGNKKVLCGLSGGVDSSVAAMLIHKAVGKQLTCIFVDHGLLRKNEGDEVEAVFAGHDFNLIRVNAQDRFYAALHGVSDPEQKRKIIGREFIHVFEAESKKLGGTDFLVQGTIYPDVIESGHGSAAVIKSHHNVGGLPDHVDFEEIIEPLRDLFKDEVREVGRVLGLPDDLVDRQPFPGPGIAIRIIGEITEDRIALVQEADHIFREELRLAGLGKEVWQYFAAFTGMKSVGVMGDERTYSHAVALRAVTSVDGMTADWARIPFPVLERVSNRIINEVPNVNRVLYDITSKPPGTIEYE